MGKTHLEIAENRCLVSTALTLKNSFMIVE